MNLFKIIVVSIILMSFGDCQGQHQKHEESKDEDQAQVSVEIDSLANLVFHDSYNDYWFASSKGIFHKTSTGVRHFTKADGLNSFRIINVQEDRDRNIYFDTPEAVYLFNGENFSELQVFESEDGEGNWILNDKDLWFRMGWNSSGPLRFDGNKLHQLKFPKSPMEDEFNRISPNASYSPYGIYTIYKDNDGKLWFGTASLGIFHYDGDKFHWMFEKDLSFTKEGGDFGIRSISEDADGNFWICNLNKKFSFKTNERSNKRLEELHYEMSAGMFEGDSPYFLSIKRDQKGGLWMVTYNEGVWHMHSGEIEKYDIALTGEDLILRSLYIDRNDEVWVGTKDHGPFIFNGRGFEKSNP